MNTSQASPKITPPGAGQEPELLALARAGDREAFASLYNEHRPEVYRFIGYRVRDKSLAEDLTSETFLRALRRIDTFTWQGRDFGAWLVTIARNLIADHFKCSRTRLEVAAGDMLDADTIAVSAEETGLRELAAVEARDIVQTAMRSLTPEQAECVRLRFLDELSLSESSAVAGRSVGSVKQATFRAMVSLRARLAVAA
ncbi:sigma-70 family RNA polymerase sigma factor [Streptomyces sp. NPDC056707]|uniref:sigma-70 family RNA polymerase sigma factor n=1 Tax=Streptomyces sp. NPDC056707 TaxID=3345919 RepID=UPI0036ACB63E